MLNKSERVVPIGIVTLSGSKPFFHAINEIEIEIIATNTVRISTVIKQIARNDGKNKSSMPVEAAKRTFMKAM